MRDKIACQEKILHLLLNKPSLINKMESHNIEPEFFDSRFRPLLHGIYNAHQNDVRLTVVSYQDFIDKSVKSGHYSKWTGKKADSPKQATLKENGLFANVSQMQRASDDDIDVYISQLKESFAREEMDFILGKFNEGAKKNFVEAISSLSENLGRLNINQSEIHSTWSFLDTDGSNFISKLKKERANPQARLLTGISELDDSMAVGLTPGSLTLFVADVGGFKTTMMLQVALNVYLRYNEDVLFVSLEMPKYMLQGKITASETGISNEHINKPELLTDIEMNRIEEEWNKFVDRPSRFCIEDTEERLAVSHIKAKIEKELGFFKPRVVVLDYITILSPEKSYSSQKTHEWVGHMCKDLRQLGRKHGFAVISAAQLGREAIKRLRSQKEGKQTVGSDDLRGSHDFSADADSIYALVPNPSQQQNQLQMFCIKSRYGKKTFAGASRAILEVNPEICRITGATDASWGDNPDDPAATQAETKEIDYDLDLDICENDTPSVAATIHVEQQKPEKGSSKRVVFDDFENL